MADIFIYKNEVKLLIRVSKVTILYTAENPLSFVPAASLEREIGSGGECKFSMGRKTFLEAGIKSNLAFPFLNRQKSVELF